MAQRHKIEESLFRTVEETYKIFQAEAANFYAVSHADLPSQIPYPDNVARITQAAKAHNEALASYRVALQRLNDHLLHGIIPPDLQQPPKK